MRALFESELAEAARNPRLWQLLAQERRSLFRRFAGYYEHLARLPRRALQRKRSLAALALLLALGQAPAPALAQGVLDDVSVTKTGSPDSVTVGAQLTYTMNVGFEGGRVHSL